MIIEKAMERAGEAEVEQELSAAQRNLNDALRANLALQERTHKLEAERRRYKVAEVTGTMDALTTSDRMKLLEVA